MDKIKGHWKMSMDSKSLVPGEYSFNDGYMKLDLDSTFENQEMEIETIFGEDFDGNKITLFDSWLVGMEHYAKFTSVTYFQDIAMIGNEYYSKESTTIKTASFTATILNDWISNFIKLSTSSAKYIVKKPDLIYEKVLFKEGEISFEFLNTHKCEDNECVIKCTPVINLKFTKSKKITEFLRFIDIFKRFFTVTSNKYTEFNYLRCIDENDKEFELLIGNINDDKKIIGGP